MKKGMKLINVMFAVSVLVVASATSSFAWSCAKMQPTTINTSSVWLKNVSGAACGTLANNASRYFLLNTNDKDPQLAILLTALSLGKNVWVNSPVDSGNGDTANVIAISQ